IRDNVRHLPRDAPFSLSYAGVIIATSAFRAVLPRHGDRAATDLSTNLSNLNHHPVRALLGSALVVDGNAALNLAFGIIPMVVSERRLGPATTAAMFVAGHVGASIITAATIRRGITTGYYPPEVAQATDIGLSYGGLAVRFAAIGAVPTRAGQLRDVARAGTLLGMTSPWKMPQDFTSTGHVVAAAIGAIGAVFIAVRRRKS
ncbi:MAG: hypothetical protein HQ526_08150, partial [Actinobacteria bacterium]|nr:hypothetical protein [Actinomycetota bacterium]